MRCHFTARSSSHPKARTARMASAKTRTLPASSMARLRLVANRLPESAKIRARSTGEEECVALCPYIMGIREAECLQCQLDGPLEWFRVGPDVPPRLGLPNPPLREARSVSHRLRQGLGLLRQRLEVLDLPSLDARDPSLEVRVELEREVSCLSLTIERVDGRIVELLPRPVGVRHMTDDQLILLAVRPIFRAPTEGDRAPSSRTDRPGGGRWNSRDGVFFVGESCSEVVRR